MRKWFMAVVAVSLALHAPSATAQRFRGLSFSTPFPAQTVRAGGVVSIPLTVGNHGLPPQIVTLGIIEAPRGWTITFLGGGRPVRSVYVAPGQEATLTARLSPPSAAASGTVRLVLAAQGQSSRATLPLTLTFGDVLPASLTLTAELPMVRGLATSSFRYRLTLTNDSNQDLLVGLEAHAPRGFQIAFTPSLTTQQVTSLPLRAGEAREIDAEVTLPRDVAAGTYEITVQASGGEARAETALGLEVTGRPELLLTGPEGRLSGRAVAGRTTPFRLTLRNDGSAPAEDVELGAVEPTGWEVRFDPQSIASLPPRQEREVLALVTPSSRAVVGDYMVTLRASGGDASTSTDFRITVQTSTLWGMVGIVLVALALGVVSLAISRYGRR